MKKMRNVLGLVLGLSLALSTFAAAAGVKLAVVGPHSGDLAPYGIPTKEAVEMYIAEVNKAGGVLGGEVEVLYLDSQCKPEIATNVAAKVASEKVNVVIGGICSGATKAALGIYKEAGVIAISPSATNPPLTQSGDYPNFYRTIAPDDEQGKMAANFVTGKLAAKKIALIHDKGDYGKGFVDFSKPVLEAAGAEIVMYEGITPGAMDYSAVVQKIRRERADAVVFGGYHPEASKLIAQMKKKRVKAPFIGPDGIKGNGFLEIAGKNAEGVYATGPMDVSSVAMNKDAKAAYQKAKNAEPGTFFDQGYAAVIAAIEAVKKAGSTDPKAIEAALKGSKFDTTLGTIGFSASGDATGVGFAVYQVQSGDFVEIK